MTIAPRLRGRKTSALTLFAALLTACTASMPATRTAPAAQASRYKADVTRTEYGIPHVVAADLGSLGYGIGYSYAQDNFCMFAEKINQLNGERSRYFGAESRAHVGTSQNVSSRESDFFYKSQFPKSVVGPSYRNAQPEVADLTRGYVAGVNRYLRETGVGSLPEPCRGAAWVRPFDEDDLYLWYTAVATLTGSQAYIEAIVAAQPAARKEARSDTAEEIGLGSNAWAFGKDATVNGRGLLLANPHWSWGNINQFYQAHLTIPGRLDVMGVTYGGMPAVTIGFNRTMAWSHTVSTGTRAVIRELTLAPDSPTAYIVDGQRHEMQKSPVTIEVLGKDGTVTPESRTFYTTQFGPRIVREGLGWGDKTAYALTDLNLANRRLISQWMAIAQASNVTDVRNALSSVLAIPWVNTLATDADGNTLYADYSIKAYLTDEMTKRCGGSQDARRLGRSTSLMLDGSRSACNPLSDPSAPQPGILPPQLLPLLSRTDYVANSNNTYWLTNARAPITGLPQVNGGEANALGFRAQSGLRIVEARLAGTDSLPGNRFDATAIKALVFGNPAYPELGNHNRAAEVMRDSIRAICTDSSSVTMPDQTTVDVSGACRILSAWDGRHAIDSVGAHVFREFFAAAQRIPNLWSTPFDPASPLETPRDPNVANPEVRGALLQSLAGAVAKLSKAGIPLDRPWGAVHTHPVGSVRVPIAGTSSDALNVMQAGALTADGYSRVQHGASYVQIVGFEDGGPQADAVLLFGQSTNPASPWYHDQLQKLWTKQEWNRLPFDRSEIERRAISRVTLEE
jgi:acyl-homoserine-lactone acylase